MVGRAEVAVVVVAEAATTTAANRAVVRVKLKEVRMGEIAKMRKTTSRGDVNRGASRRRRRGGGRRMGIRICRKFAVCCRGRTRTTFKAEFTNFVDRWDDVLHL